MTELIAAFSGYIPWLTLLILALVFRRSVKKVLAAIRDRIAAGSEFQVGSGIGSMKLGPIVLNTEDAKQHSQEQGSTVQVFGNPDHLKLLFKVQGASWKKSTKALQVPGGCLIQVTTERLATDGSWTAAEALEYVPGVAVVPVDADGMYELGALQP